MSEQPAAPKPLDVVHDFLIDLARAKHVGAREFRTNLSRLVDSSDLTIITLKGKPRQVMVPFERMVSLLETHTRYCKMIDLIQGVSK